MASNSLAVFKTTSSLLASSHPLNEWVGGWVGGWIPAGINRVALDLRILRDVSLFLPASSSLEERRWEEEAGTPVVKIVGRDTLGDPAGVQLSF